MIQIDYDRCLPELVARGLLPEGHRAVYISGSIARGWGHATSDLDVYVISDEPWTGEITTKVPVALEPDIVPMAVIYVDGMRWTIEYWLDGQIDQLIDKVAWDPGAGSPKSADLITSPIQKELNILERMSYAVVLSGTDWVEERRRRIAASGMRSLAASTLLNVLDTYLEDVAGLLESGDVESALLSARLAFHNAVDALLAHHGEVGRDGKWQAKRVRLVDSKVLPFDLYWRLETLQGFDVDNPVPWIESVVDLCRQISFEIVL
ncbi:MULTISPECIES: hypothetical protein [unclassified Streptomyces]|uniref:hypothetical protein n=1 Tax=unclassified Streptomyces TaxID=2593676 RepID=UPI00190E44A0|nr:MULTISPECIES: hypothetical protein [unclassified Streptomyces]MBK3571228.1 hypothetical protein [Streptomyces sp. MBT62]MBK6017089.1 hypothetical protein [Streptomyces sp. MBT53]